MCSQNSHKKLDDYLLKLEINNDINPEKLIRMLGFYIGSGDVISIAMINMFIRNNNIKLLNGSNYQNKLYEAIDEGRKERYILDCNEELKKPYNKGCCISFIPFEELKDTSFINMHHNLFNE